MSIPYLSVIIPTHKRPALLRRSLSSVLRSSLRDIEVLVISDLFCEHTYQIVHSLKDARLSLYMNDSFVGPADSRNFGIRSSRGQYCFFLDDDDAVDPEYLEGLVNHKSIGNEIVYSNATIVEEDRQSGREFKRYALDVEGMSSDSVWIKNFIHINTILYPSSIIRELSFDHDLKSLEDWDFLLTALSRGGELRYIPKLFGAIIYKDYTNQNRRGNSQDASNSNVLRDYLRIYARSPAPNSELTTKRGVLINEVTSNSRINILDYVG